MPSKLYILLANKVAARINLIESDYISEWEEIHGTVVEKLVKNYLPSGSGFDVGTKIDWDKSTGEHLIFQTSFHHLNDVGTYDGWTEHSISVRPSLIHGFTITISGRNRNDIKDYIAEIFTYVLNTSIEDDLNCGASP